MNTETGLLVEEAVTRVRTSLLDGEPVAVIGIEADEPIWLSDLSYWRAPAEFEIEGGQLAQHNRSDRAVFAVPLITLADSEGALVFRPTNGTVHPSEVQQVWIVTVDLADGMDVHRCVYQRAPDGLPQFFPIQTYDGDVRLDRGAPGWHLVQAVISPESAV